jgi:hypothetical protein
LFSLVNHLSFMQYWSLHYPSFLLGGGPSRGRRQKQGEDVVHSLKVSLEDVFNGTTKKLSLSRNVLCAKCKGYGFIHVYIVCTSNFFLKFWQPIKFSFRICMLSLAALYQFDGFLTIIHHIQYSFCCNGVWNTNWRLDWR